MPVQAAQPILKQSLSAWFGQRYTIAVLAGAIVALGVFYWLGQDWETALYRAATLLVAASPCAIVISVPAAILSALSAAARGGVLFKGGAALETLAAVDIFAFDKTGTLTTSRGDRPGQLSERQVRSPPALPPVEASCDGLDIGRVGDGRLRGGGFSALLRTIE